MNLQGQSMLLVEESQQSAKHDLLLTSLEENNREKTVCVKILSRSLYLFNSHLNIRIIIMRAQEIHWLEELWHQFKIFRYTNNNLLKQKSAEQKIHYYLLIFSSKLLHCKV